MTVACRNRLVWIAVLVGTIWMGTGRPGEAAGLNAFFPERGSGQVALSYTQESYDHFWLGTRLTSVPAVGEVV